MLVRFLSLIRIWRISKKPVSKRPYISTKLPSSINNITILFFNMLYLKTLLTVLISSFPEIGNTVFFGRNILYSLKTAIHSALYPFDLKIPDKCLRLLSLP